MKITRQQNRRLRWWILFLINLAPLMYWLYMVFNVVLMDPYIYGPEPGEVLIHWLGHTSMVMLIIVLFLRPLAQWQKSLKWLMQFRRMFGLSLYGYLSLHLAGYLVFDQNLQWSLIGGDIIKSPYLIIGLLAWLLVTPLAITSLHVTRKMMSSKGWKRLHRLVYTVAVLAIVHYLLLIRANWLYPAIYSAIVIGLLLIRLPSIQRLRSTDVLALLNKFSKHG